MRIALKLALIDFFIVPLKGRWVDFAYFSSDTGDGKKKKRPFPRG